MKIKDILDDLKPEDFVIRITPFHEEGKWDGDVQVSLVSSVDNPLSEEDFEYLSHLCNMLCSVVPVIEEDEYVRDALHNYVNNRLNDEVPDVDNEPSYTADGNVLTLSSKTRGTC
tara:strand:- start:573 stop:917 length:345 start_codon:yes stop_codon:yes gene_type:complete